MYNMEVTEMLQLILCLISSLFIALNPVSLTLDHNAYDVADVSKVDSTPGPDIQHTVYTMFLHIKRGSGRVFRYVRNAKKKNKLMRYFVCSFMRQVFAYLSHIKLVRYVLKNRIHNVALEAIKWYKAHTPILTRRLLDPAYVESVLSVLDRRFRLAYAQFWVNYFKRPALVVGLMAVVTTAVLVTSSGGNSLDLSLITSTIGGTMMTKATKVLDKPKANQRLQIIYEDNRGTLERKSMTIPTRTVLDKFFNDYVVVTVTDREIYDKMISGKMVPDYEAKVLEDDSDQYKIETIALTGYYPALSYINAKDGGIGVLFFVKGKGKFLDGLVTMGLKATHSIFGGHGKTMKYLKRVFAPHKAYTDQMPTLHVETGVAASYMAGGLLGNISYLSKAFPELDFEVGQLWKVTLLTNKEFHKGHMLVRDFGPDIIAYEPKSELSATKDECQFFAILGRASMNETIRTDFQSILDFGMQDFFVEYMTEFITDINTHMDDIEYLRDKLGVYANLENDKMDYLLVEAFARLKNPMDYPGIAKRVVRHFLEVIATVSKASVPFPEESGMRGYLFADPTALGSMGEHTDKGVLEVGECHINADISGEVAVYRQPHAEGEFDLLKAVNNQALCKYSGDSIFLSSKDPEWLLLVLWRFGGGDLDDGAVVLMEDKLVDHFKTLRRLEEGERKIEKTTDMHKADKIVAALASFPPVDLTEVGFRKLLGTIGGEGMIGKLENYRMHQVALHANPATGSPVFGIDQEGFIDAEAKDQRTNHPAAVDADKHWDETEVVAYSFTDDAITNSRLPRVGKLVELNGHRVRKPGIRTRILAGKDEKSLVAELRHYLVTRNSSEVIERHISRKACKKLIKSIRAIRSAKVFVAKHEWVNNKGVVKVINTPVCEAVHTVEEAVEDLHINMNKNLLINLNNISMKPATLSVPAHIRSDAALLRQNWNAHFIRDDGKALSGYDLGEAYEAACEEVANFLAPLSDTSCMFISACIFSNTYVDKELTEVLAADILDGTRGYPDGLLWSADVKMEDPLTGKKTVIKKGLYHYTLDLLEACGEGAYARKVEFCDLDNNRDNYKYWASGEETVVVAHNDVRVKGTNMYVGIAEVPNGTYTMKRGWIFVYPSFNYAEKIVLPKSWVIVEGWHSKLSSNDKLSMDDVQDWKEFFNGKTATITYVEKHPVTGNPANEVICESRHVGWLQRKDIHVITDPIEVTLNESAFKYSMVAIAQ